MLRSIVVPLDGSPFAEQALPYAEAIAARAHSRIHLVRVHETVDVSLPYVVPGGAAGMAVLDGRDRERETGYLAAVAAHVDPSLPLRTELLDGDVVEALHVYLIEAGADLAVLSTHGRGGIARAWLGSVAEGLMRRARVPLLLVPPLRHGAPPPRPVLRRLLVPLDGSRFAEQVLPVARELAVALELEIRLLLVLPPAVLPPPEDVPAFGSSLEGLEAVRPRAEAYLTRLAAGLRDRLNVRTEVCADTQVARHILASAQENRADLVAMATHARHGAARLFLGSVADKVVRAGIRPVLLVRPRGPRWKTNVEPGRWT